MDILRNYSENGLVNIRPEEVAFDIDGVFADTFRALVNAAGRDYGISIDYDDITEYEFWNVIDISEKICREIVQRIMDEPLKMGIVPLDGAVNVLKRLTARGPVLFVSARPERESIFLWIKEYMKAVDPALIRIEAVGGHEEKAPVLRKNDIKYFVEDRLETCYLLDRASIIPIVFDQPWNRKKHPFVTVRNWQDICGMIEW